MSWKDDLLELKRQERWMDIIVSCEQQIQKDNNSADSYIQTIYLTHDILLEEYPTPQEEQEAQRLLIHTFSDGQQRHWDNAEYLFFIGSLVPIAEWLFGLKESSKPLEKRIGYEMVKKATLLDPHNLLYRWSYQDIIEILNPNSWLRIYYRIRLSYPISVVRATRESICSIFLVLPALGWMIDLQNLF